MKILFIGDLNEYGRSFQRCRTLVELGHRVKSLSSVPVPYRPGLDGNIASLWERVRWKLRLPLDPTGVNQSIIKAVNSEQFDVIWVEKGVTVRPATLFMVKSLQQNAKLVSVSEDDMYAKHNRSRYYTRGLPYYDVVFTTKTYNLSELKELGAQRTELFLDSYDEKVHRPMELSNKEMDVFGAEAGFIGTFERQRANDMLFLAKNGVPVTVWGNGWHEWTNKHSNLIVKDRPVYGEDYAKAINATKVNLCFLRKVNRDTVTSRSVEIPACGGFMLGERTDRHLDFFEEGKEAEFFGSREELLLKTKKYLKDDESRQSIATAGRKRCLESGYSTREQLEQMLGRL